MNQRDAIYQHLLINKAITAQEAMNHPQIKSMRLAARIEELRKRGHNVYTEMVSENGRTFARYHLIEPEKKSMVA